MCSLEPKFEDDLKKPANLRERNTEPAVNAVRELKHLASCWESANIIPIVMEGDGS